MTKFAEIGAGDPAPSFAQRASNNPRFAFSSAAGRLLVLCLMGSGATPHGREAIAAAMQRRDLFDDHHAAFFGVSMDEADEAGRLVQQLPGYRYFWDRDGTIGRLCGALPLDFRQEDGWAGLRGRWVLIDRAHRVLDVIPFADDRSDIARVLEFLEHETRGEALAGSSAPAPVLILPRVFSPELCRELLDHYARADDWPSGFMVEEGGRTVLRSNPSHKRRRDVVIEDEALRARLRDEIRRKIVPQICKAFQFGVTRIERYLIGCYTDRDHGMFNPHRDNTTLGTAHRRFAVSVLLNEDYEGGALRFAEFGDALYKPPAGGAAVFSCSLLHEVLPVTRGQRFVFVPFLFDEEAERIRRKNLEFVSPALSDGRAPASPARADR